MSGCGPGPERKKKLWVIVFILSSKRITSAWKRYPATREDLIMASLRGSYLSSIIASSSLGSPPAMPLWDEGERRKREGNPSLCQGQETLEFAEEKGERQKKVSPLLGMLACPRVAKHTHKGARRKTPTE